MFGVKDGLLLVYQNASIEYATNINQISNVTNEKVLYCALLEDQKVEQLAVLVQTETGVVLRFLRLGKVLKVEREIKIHLESDVVNFAVSIDFFAVACKYSC
jgi:hypothetical protein